MTLSNSERQARFRRKLRDDRTGLEHLVEVWRVARQSLLQQRDATTERDQEAIADYDRLIATYSPQARTGASLVDAGIIAATRVGASVRLAMADLEDRTDVKPEEEPLRRSILAQMRATAELQEEHIRQLKAEPPGIFYDSK
ncbi:hypothetical protein [Caulobacter sp.]|uniref:hypothetical protein n=1 Tax=Caulobacter sp. TaxID=78 RepID=UPI003BACB1A8